MVSGRRPVSRHRDYWCGNPLATSRLIPGVFNVAAMAGIRLTGPFRSLRGGSWRSRSFTLADGDLRTDGRWLAPRRRGRRAVTRRSVLAIALAAVLVLAACGDDDDSASGGDVDGGSGGGAATTKTTTITVDPGPGCKVTGYALAAMAEGVRAGRFQIVAELVPLLAEPVCVAAFEILNETTGVAEFEVTTATGTSLIPLSRSQLIPSAATPTDCDDWPSRLAQTRCRIGYIKPPAMDLNPSCDGWLPVTALVTACEREIIGPPA
jgi:hypothetical protein